MADHTYGISEIVGTSPDSIHQAVRNGVAKASHDGPQPRLVRGDVGPRPDHDGEVAHFQVQMKVGFRIE